MNPNDPAFPTADGFHGHGLTKREWFAGLGCGIPFGAPKDDLISARRAVKSGNFRAAVLHMKWAMEKLLPEGQQYCSQTLPDDDPEKTLQGYLDNIVADLRETPKPQSDTPAFDALYPPGSIKPCKTCGKPISETVQQCIHCLHFQ